MVWVPSVGPVGVCGRHLRTPTIIPAYTTKRNSGGGGNSSIPTCLIVEGDSCRRIRVITEIQSASGDASHSIPTSR